MRNTKTHQSDNVSEALMIAIYISAIGLATIFLTLFRAM